MVECVKSWAILIICHMHTKTGDMQLKSHASPISSQSAGPLSGTYYDSHHSGSPHWKQWIYKYFTSLYALKLSRIYTVSKEIFIFYNLFSFCFNTRLLSYWLSYTSLVHIIVGLPPVDPAHNPDVLPHLDSLGLCAVPSVVILPHAGQRVR